MTKPYSDLIRKLFPDSEADRKLAQAFADHFSGVPGMADRVEPLLREAARPNEQVGSGEMSPESAWAYLKDYAAAIGTPPHALAGFDTWFDSTTAEFAAETPPQPSAETPAEPAAEPTSPAQAPAAAPAKPSHWLHLSIGRLYRQKSQSGKARCALPKIQMPGEPTGGVAGSRRT